MPVHTRLISLLKNLKGINHRVLPNSRKTGPSKMWSTIAVIHLNLLIPFGVRKLSVQFMYFSLLWGNWHTRARTASFEVSRPLSLSQTRTHTRTHTLYVGLLCTSDQPVAEAATYIKHNKHIEANIHVPCGIRTCIPSNRTAADLRLRLQGHRDFCRSILSSPFISEVIKTFAIIAATRTSLCWQHTKRPDLILRGFLRT